MKAICIGGPLSGHEEEVQGTHMKVWGQADAGRYEWVFSGLCEKYGIPEAGWTQVFAVWFPA